MSDVFGGTIHYRSVFDAKCVNGDWSDAYPDLSKRVRTWAEDTLAVPRDSFKNKKFLLGGTFKEECPPRTYLETISRNYNTQGMAPTYWGCRIAHPCTAFPYRRWTHDLTVTCHTPNTFRIAVVTRHSIAGYLGEEPESPEASVPGIVQSLVTSRHWRCTSGSELLSDRPVEVFTGYLNLLKDSITSATRTCPVVYASLSQDSSLPLVDVDQMARLLCGAAKVYVAADVDADPELEKLLGDLGTWNGGVRVYQPAVNLNSEADKKRHRFFAPYDIRKYGTREVVLQIVRACCRRAQIFAPNDVVSIEAIVSTARRRRLHELTHARGRNVDTELIELAQDLDKQVTELQREKSRLSSDVENVMLESEIEVEELRKELARAKYEIESQKKTIAELYQRGRSPESSTEIGTALKKLPTSVEDVLRLVCSIHSDKLDYLPEAIESAKVAKFNDMARTWDLLWSLADPLHAMLFDESVSFSDAHYQDLTGFHIAMSEGKQTQRNNKLMRLRERDYLDRRIDITPHVGIGSGADCIRVHFARDPETRKLIIGHCGDHLDNALTRKRK